MTTLLVLTAGQTDVQLVIDGVRHELEPRMCGVLHDEIERRGYRLVDAPVPKDRQRKGELPEGDLTLCTPKLDAALRSFDRNSTPAAALIFDTRRTLPSDPRLAGAVLERRLNERGVQVARRHALLTGKDLLEDPNDQQDAVVRREVVQGVAQVLATEFAKVKPDRVVAATTGGLAAANVVIEELVRLYAGRDSVQVVEIPDGAFSGQADRVVPEKFHPATGLRARWQALSLIEEGNLLAAWGPASQVTDVPGQGWTRVVKWLARFASSRPMPEACDISVLTHPQMAVRAALRVELALRAGDIPRAIHGTVAFFEAALWDGLNERVERSSDPARRRYYRIKSGEPPSGKKLLRQGDGSKKDRECPFEYKDTTDDGTDWYWIYDGDGGPAARLATRFLERCGLVAFDKALGSEIRALRNDVAHNEPTPELMDDARAQMRKAGIWSDTDTFLSQARVQDVLRELGEKNPKALCEDLIALVKCRLLRHDLLTASDATTGSV